MLAYRSSSVLVPYEFFLGFAKKDFLKDLTSIQLLFKAYENRRRRTPS